MGVCQASLPGPTSNPRSVRALARLAIEFVLALKKVLRRYMLAGMLPEIVIRQARPDENNAVHALVQAIADETFAYLFASSQVPIGAANWFAAWLAISNEEIVGVTMTQGEWVSDLWVRQDWRRLGIGAKLLSHAELEISSRGQDTFRLRVVKSNLRAVQFYQSQGWKVHREFPHESFGHAMFEMTKSNQTIPTP